MPLQAPQVAKLLKTAATLSGKDSRNFGSVMFRGNISKTTIKLFDRWSTDAFERYIQIADCDVEDMARRMAGKLVSYQGYH
jgi:hypothetical protein